MFLSFIENGKCEHAIEIVEERVPLLFVEMHQHLRVALGTKSMSFRNQSFADFDVVVYLAIQNDPDRPVFIANRLRSPFKIDDGETAMAKQAASVHVFLARTSVGATMR